MIRPELSSDTQPEVGQNIAGGVNQVAVFIKINCAAAGGSVVVHQIGSVLIKFHRPPCDHHMFISLIEVPSIVFDLKKGPVGVLLEAGVCTDVAAVIEWDAVRGNKHTAIFGVNEVSAHRAVKTQDSSMPSLLNVIPVESTDTVPNWKTFP